MRIEASPLARSFADVASRYAAINRKLCQHHDNPVVDNGCYLTGAIDRLLEVGIQAHAFAWVENVELPDETPDNPMRSRIGGAALAARLQESVQETPTPAETAVRETRNLRIQSYAEALQQVATEAVAAWQTYRTLAENDPGKAEAATKVDALLMQRHNLKENLVDELNHLDGNLTFLAAIREMVENF